ncbi:MAG: HAMP domain-containing protein [Lachnospiraceae bacterium]|jgi:methyl-accepting chemotaxis protein|nr:HAMP domain-containing protein [Lachnospiraceae bacterium]
MKQQKKRKTSQKRIADEILQQIGGSVIIVFLLIAVVAMFMVGWLSISSKEKELIQESNAAANQLTGFLEQYIKCTEQLAQNPEIKQVMNEIKPGDDISKAEKMETVLENLIHIANTDTENVMATWISDLDASALIQSDGFVSDEDWDITGRGWYGCIETKEPILTEPYIDSSTGKLILSAACPVMDDTTGTVLGAVGMDISLDHMTTVMSEYKIGNKGYILLLSENGTFLYHPQSDIIQKNVKDINISENVLNAMESKKDEFLKYRAQGQTKYGSLQHAGDTGYIVLSCLPLSEYYAMLIGMIVALIVIFSVGILLITFNIKKSASNLTKPILELNHTAQQLADGNLNVNINITSSNEIGELGESFQKTVNRLKEYIAYIDETSEVLAQIANGKLSIDLKNDYVGEFHKIKTALLHISDSMNQVMIGINESSERVSIGASELASASQVLAEGAELQAASIEELAATTNTVADQVENSRREAEASAKATAQTATMIEENQAKMQQMMEAMHKIHETSQQVVGIIQTIEDIASQTNLLSLNASIEAARAGDAGRGFAVVADEIGKLALESSKAANTTKELIEISMEEINKGNTITVGAMNSLKESVSAVDQVNNMIQETAQSAAIQAENMKQLRVGIEEMAHGIQDNSAASQQTSATSEELASQADILNQMVQKFELHENG